MKNVASDPFPMDILWKNRKTELKWCPVSRHSWLHFLVMSADPSPHLLKKDACIWSREQLGNVPLRPKATCCHMVFGAGGVMLELFCNNKEKKACYDWKQQWLVSWEWSQTKTVNSSRQYNNYQCVHMRGKILMIKMTESIFVVSDLLWHDSFTSPFWNYSWLWHMLTKIPFHQAPPWLVSL